jgi:hypothetical protein
MPTKDYLVVGSALLIIIALTCIRRKSVVTDEMNLLPTFTSEMQEIHPQINVLNTLNVTKIL